MSNEMIRELSATEIDMVSGAFSFSGGFGLGGGFEFGIGGNFDDLTLGFELDLNLGILDGIGGMLSGLLGNLFG